MTWLPDVLSVCTNTAWLAPPVPRPGDAADAVLAKAGPAAKGTAIAAAGPAAAMARADPRRIGTLTEHSSRVGVSDGPVQSREGRPRYTASTGWPPRSTARPGLIT